MRVLLILAAVNIFGPTVRLVPLQQLAARCPVDAYACTVFRETVLLTQCQDSSEGWRMEATALVHPRVFTSTPRLMAHEISHIDDITSLLDEHVQSLSSVTFPSQERCERAAEQARKNLYPSMRRFQRISALRRDRLTD